MSLCQVARNEWGWISWTASRRIAGAVQSFVGSRSRKMWPFNSGGCSQRSKPLDVVVVSLIAPTPPRCLVIKLPVLLPPPPPAATPAPPLTLRPMSFWWSRNHSQSSWDSHPQCNGFPENFNELTKLMARRR